MYAGHARLLSARATVPQLVFLAANGPLLDGELPPSEVPVFAGLAGGLAGLTDALAARVDVRTGATVRELDRTETGFALVVGPTTAPERIEADAVVLATPAAPTARLLTGVAPAAAHELAEVEYASMAVVTLAFRAEDVHGPRRLLGLPGPARGRPGDQGVDVLLRQVGLGACGGRPARPGAPAHLTRPAPRGGHPAARRRRAGRGRPWPTSPRRWGSPRAPVDTHVQRWGGGLPQYAVGHLDRVARIRAAVAAVPGLAVCGAAYDGVGIPAVIGSARRAVTELEERA